MVLDPAACKIFGPVPEDGVDGSTGWEPTFPVPRPMDLDPDLIPGGEAGEGEGRYQVIAALTNSVASAGSAGEAFLGVCGLGGVLHGSIQSNCSCK